MASRRCKEHHTLTNTVGIWRRAVEEDHHHDHDDNDNDHTETESQASVSRSIDGIAHTKSMLTRDRTQRQEEGRVCNFLKYRLRKIDGCMVYTKNGTYKTMGSIC